MAEMPSADLNLNFGMLIFDSSTAKSQNLITGRAAGSGMEGEGGLLQESDSEAHPATCQPAGRHLWGPVPWEGRTATAHK